jgi:hypothetical protein
MTATRSAPVSNRQQRANSQFPDSFRALRVIFARFAYGSPAVYCARFASVHDPVLRASKREHYDAGRDLLEHHPRAEVGPFLHDLAVDDQHALVRVGRIDTAADDEFGSVCRQALDRFSRRGRRQRRSRCGDRRGRRRLGRPERAARDRHRWCAGRGWRDGRHACAWRREWWRAGVGRDP